MRCMIIGSALSVVATTALAQDFGGQYDQDYAAEIWQYLQEQNFAGQAARMSWAMAQPATPCESKE